MSTQGCARLFPTARRTWHESTLLAAIALAGLHAWPGRLTIAAGDISALDQHFNQPGKDISPWMFVPAENIKEFSTEEHPGLATIYRGWPRQGHQGDLEAADQDRRLPAALGVSDLARAELQSDGGRRGQDTGQCGDRAQCRGHLLRSVDLAQPTGRSARRRTREFQLLVVHLGCTGEAGSGIAPVFDRAPSRDVPGLGAWRSRPYGHGRLANSLRLDRRRCQVCRAREPAVVLPVRAPEPDAARGRNQV